MEVRPQGLEGPSAYQVALETGYVGTETEWLESLIGPEGPTAYQVAVEAGFTGTVDEWLESLRGEPGADSTVQGPPGPPGPLPSGGCAWAWPARIDRAAIAAAIKARPGARGPVAAAIKARPGACGPVAAAIKTGKTAHELVAAATDPKLRRPSSAASATIAKRNARVLIAAATVSGGERLRFGRRGDRVGFKGDISEACARSNSSRFRQGRGGNVGSDEARGNPSSR